MKKSILLLFAALLPLVASAEKVEINGIWYHLVPKAKQAEVTYQGDNSWDYNEYSGSITLPATVTYNGVAYSVTSIGDWAFLDCSSLTSITIPEGVTSIGWNAFSGCSSLTAITIPEGVTSIGDGAFSGCSSLASITIPESVTTIGDYAFSWCSSLTAITIPEGVTSIGEGAFFYCSSLTDITIPESSQLTSIGYRAFEGCSRLTAITLPEGVTSIGEYAFLSCTSLTAITIPEGVTSIGWSAFNECSSLTAIVLPKNLNYIDSKAFANCSELLDVYCYAEEVPSTEADAFDGSHPEYVTLHVPARALETYKTTSPWSNFGTIVSLTDEEMGIEKSEIKNQKSEIIYDLQGHRVTHPTKGIYIIDGKKKAIK